MSAPASLKRSILYRLARKVKRRLCADRRQPQMRQVELSKLLLGDEHGFPAAKYARIVGNPLRPSTPLSRSPHVLFLEQYRRLGKRVFEPGTIEHTEYYRNAQIAIDILGFYFEAKRDEDIVKVARRFSAMFDGSDGPIALERGQTPPGGPLRVRPIKHSECLQIVDGHHRAAVAFMKGETSVSAMVDPDEVHTPLQTALLEVLWLNGRLELYQPVEAPELKAQWTILRKCTDRRDMIWQFLEQNDLVPGEGRSFLDVASSYGWFVSEFAKLGFEAVGVERDPLARAVGLSVYNLQSDQVIRRDAVRFLRDQVTAGRRFDVVCCFSLLHHFVLGNGSVSAQVLVQLLRSVTGRVLFVDTGQEHEVWYRETLRGWNAEFVRQWLRENAAFRDVIPLGVDGDAVGRYANGFGRTLFACVI